MILTAAKSATDFSNSAPRVRLPRTSATSAALRLKAMLLTCLITSLHASSHFENIGYTDFVNCKKLDKPVLIASWHGNLMTPLYCFRRHKLVIMSSLSDDGELMARVLESFNYQVVRGSSSRGGARGLLEMVKMVKAGNSAALTVDGPRGPKHVVKPGMVMIAQKSGAYVIPVGVACSKSVSLNSWDKTQIPLPFGHIVMHSGKPFVIDPAITVEDGCQMIGQRLLDSGRQAEIYLKTGKISEA